MIKATNGSDFCSVPGHSELITFQADQGHIVYNSSHCCVLIIFITQSLVLVWTENQLIMTHEKRMIRWDFMEIVNKTGFSKGISIENLRHGVFIVIN